MLKKTYNRTCEKNDKDAWHLLHGIWLSFVSVIKYIYRNDTGRRAIYIDVSDEVPKFYLLYKEEYL